MIPCLATAQSATPMLASQPAFSLIVKGSVIGLTGSVVMLLTILAYEWWKGHVW
jgi:hypothetical protein